MDIIKAKSLLKDYTSVVFKDDAVYYSEYRGVKPLMILFDNGVDVSCGEAADRVIGRGAAYLYAALKIKHVSAYVISKPAIEVLERYGIEFDSDEVADNIRNHTNTGICPMEEVTENATCPQEAIKLMKARLKQMYGDKA